MGGEALGATFVRSLTGYLDTAPRIRHARAPTRDGNAVTAAPASYDDLTALFVNCTLTPSPGLSHTQLLMDRSLGLMRDVGVTVDTVRVADHVVPPGVQPDMTDHGAERDDWPALQQRVLDADILVLGTPIWLGDKSSVCTRVIERLYGFSGQTNAAGQYLYYGRVGGVVVTGNEDGIKHVAMSVLYSLQHLGYVVPPQADAGWIGEVGPGPSYGDRLDDGTVAGADSDFTERNLTFMTWNLLHLARMLKDAGGIPAHGNVRTAWDTGTRYGLHNPEYR